MPLALDATLTTWDFNTQTPEFLCRGWRAKTPYRVELSATVSGYAVFFGACPASTRVTVIFNAPTLMIPFARD